MSNDPQVILLPTGGVRSYASHLPNRTGRFRIIKFAEIMRRHPQAVGLIAGGMPNADGISEADVYMAFLKARYGDVAERVAVVCGEGDFTVDDLRNGSVLFRNTAWADCLRMACVTRPGHYRRIKPVAISLGYEPTLEPSGEPCFWMTAIPDYVLGVVTELDPAWERSVGRLLRRNVRHRAAKARKIR